MLNLILIVAVVLIIAVAFTAYRVTTLVDVVKNKKKAQEDWVEVPKSNSWQAVLGILFLVFGVAGFFYFSITEADVYNLPIASEHGEETQIASSTTGTKWQVQGCCRNHASWRTIR